jgi:hypothetical protein
VLDADSKSVFKEEAFFSLGPSEVKEATSLSETIGKTKGIIFVVLNLKNSAGIVVSHNVYWLSSDGDYKPINNLQDASVSVIVLKSEKLKAETRWTIQVNNPGDRIAFFIRPQVMIGNEEILPSYWSGNYFTLAPGENKTLTVSCPNAKIGLGKPNLKVSGWNVKIQENSLNLK